MQLGHLQRLGRQVDAEHAGPATRHRIGQDAATAAGVDDALALQLDMLLDPAETQRIDLVQRPELAFPIPPAVRQLAELGEFLGIGVERRHAPDVNQRDAERLLETALACLLLPMPAGTKNKTPPSRGVASANR